MGSADSAAGKSWAGRKPIALMLLETGRGAAIAVAPLLVTSSLTTSDPSPVDWLPLSVMLLALLDTAALALSRRWNRRGALTLASDLLFLAATMAVATTELTPLAAPIIATLVWVLAARVSDSGPAFGFWLANTWTMSTMWATYAPGWLVSGSAFNVSLALGLVLLLTTLPLFAYLRVTKRGRSTPPLAGRRDLSGKPARVLAGGALLIAYGLAIAVVATWGLAREVPPAIDCAAWSTRCAALRGIRADLEKQFTSEDVESTNPELAHALARYASISGTNLYLFKVGPMGSSGQREITFLLGAHLGLGRDGPESGVPVASWSEIPPEEQEALTSDLAMGAEDAFYVRHSASDRWYFGGHPAALPLFAGEEGSRVPTTTPSLVVVASDQSLWAAEGSQVSPGLYLTLGLANAAPWLLVGLVVPVSVAFFAFSRARKREAREFALIERARIAQDAHDKVYNRLAALSKRVELASDSISADVGRSLGEVAADIRGTVEDLQGILGDSRRAVAAVSGTDVLRTQLADICRAQGNRFGMQVALEAPQTLPDLSPEAGWDLQCIVEEALTNAAKHGHAEHASVTVELPTDGTLRLTITDDGQGMDPVPDIDTLPESSTGLRGIRGRVAKLGGTLCVTSEPGETKVGIEVAGVGLKDGGRL